MKNMSDINKKDIVNDSQELDQRLEEAFSRFEQGQKKLKEQLINNPDKCLEDLNKWTEKRQRQCAVLQFLLEHLREEIEKQIRPVDNAKFWQERLAAIIEEESKLYEILLRVKKDIKRQMLEASRNKKALSGYRLHKKDPYYVSTEA